MGPAEGPSPHTKPCQAHHPTYLFLLGALFRGYLGCRRRRRVLGLLKVGDVRIFFFLWLWTPFRTAFLAFSALAFASVLGGTAVTTPQSAQSRSACPAAPPPAAAGRISSRGTPTGDLCPNSSSGSECLVHNNPAEFSPLPSCNQPRPAAVGLPRALHVPADQRRPAALQHPAIPSARLPQPHRTPRGLVARRPPSSEPATSARPHPPSSLWAPSWADRSRKGLPSPRRTGLLAPNLARFPFRLAAGLAGKGSLGGGASVERAHIAPPAGHHGSCSPGPPPGSGRGVDADASGAECAALSTERSRRGGGTGIAPRYRREGTGDSWEEGQRNPGVRRRSTGTTGTGRRLCAGVAPGGTWGEVGWGEVGTWGWAPSGMLYMGTAGRGHTGTAGSAGMWGWWGLGMWGWWDLGIAGLRDAGTVGFGDSETWDLGTWRQHNLGTWGQRKLGTVGCGDKGAVGFGDMGNSGIWGHGDSTVWGHGDSGTWGHGDSRTWGRGDIRIWDTATAPLPPVPPHLRRPSGSLSPAPSRPSHPSGRGAP